MIMTKDKIYKQTAINVLANSIPSLTTPDGSNLIDHDIFIAQETIVDCIEMIKQIEPVLEIRPYSYEYCVNAMIVMWMEDILTDDQYFGIMKKLNTNVEWDDKNKEYKFKKKD